MTHSSNPFQVNIAKNSQSTRREKTSERKDIKFLSFQICAVTNLSAPSCFCRCFFLLCLGRSFQSLNFWMMSAENSLLGTLKENSQIFIEDFYLPLYLPLWVRRKTFAGQQSLYVGERARKVWLKSYSYLLLLRILLNLNTVQLEVHITYCIEIVYFCSNHTVNDDVYRIAYTIK